jgi:ABC-type glycerol-3-phosphate transport system substrate-binding protein
MAAGAALVAACAPAAPGAPAAEEAAAGADAPAGAAPEIRFASFDWFAHVPGITWDGYNQEEAFPEFKKTYPDVEILWEPNGDGWEDKILTQMAAGSAPDIISTWPPIVNSWAEKQQLLDLQPMLDVEIPNADELFFQSAWEQMWDPFNQIRMAMITGVDVNSVYYDKRAFEEAGIPEPTGEWTVDEYAEIAEKLIKRDANGNITRWGGHIRPNWWEAYFNYVEAFGGLARDEETKMTCLLGEEPAQQALEWIRKNMWDINSLVQNNQVGATGIPSWWTGLLPAGVLAMTERSADQFFSLADAMPEGSWNMTHIPQGPVDRATMGAPDCWVAYKGVTERGNQDAVWAMLKWLATSDYYQDNVAAKAGRLPGLLTSAEKWPATLRAVDGRLEGVNLEVVLEQINSGEARRVPIFRFQAVAEEIIDPAMEQIYVEGKAPVSLLADIAPQVNEAQQAALERAGGA